MELKLLKNEVRFLAENLQTVSQELLVLQDFLKLHYGSKYTTFYENRAAGTAPDETVEEDDHNIQPSKNIQKGSAGVKSSSSTPFRIGMTSETGRQTRQSTSKTPKIVSIQSQLVNYEEQQEKENSEHEDSNGSFVIYNALDQEDEFIEDSNPAGSNYEYEGSNSESDSETNYQGNLRRSRKRKFSETVDPDFNPEDCPEADVKLNFGGADGRRITKKFTPFGDEKPGDMLESRSLSFLKVRDYDSLEEAQQDVKKEYCLRSHYTSLEGTRYRYNCRIRCCPKHLSLFHPSEVGEDGPLKVSRWETAQEHLHQGKTLRGIDKDLQEVISELYLSGVKKSSLIRFALKKRGINLPLENKVFFMKFKNYLAALRKKYNDVQKRPTFPPMNPSGKRRGRPPKRVKSEDDPQKSLQSSKEEIPIPNATIGEPSSTKSPQTIHQQTEEVMLPTLNKHEQVQEYITPFNPGDPSGHGNSSESGLLELGSLSHAQSSSFVPVVPQFQGMPPHPFQGHLSTMAYQNQLGHGSSNNYRNH